VLRGWINYFRHTQVKRVLEEMDGWLRRRLRGLLWRQAKTRQARTVMLRRQGLVENRAWRSAHNGQGPWWNAGASHMNTAFPKRFFLRRLGAGFAAGHPATPPALFMNRRMRNRTYSGVRGRRG
jgi:RNA-directed DNA polymerase